MTPDLMSSPCCCAGVTVSRVCDSGLTYRSISSLFMRVPFGDSGARSRSFHFCEAQEAIRIEPEARSVGLDVDARRRHILGDHHSSAEKASLADDDLVADAGVDAE